MGGTDTTGKKPAWTQLGKNRAAFSLRDGLAGFSLNLLDNLTGDIDSYEPVLPAAGPPVLQ